MQKLFSRFRTFGTAAIAALTLGAGAMPATAGTLYQWRTEDGSFAFADSLKKVPARYRSEMTTSPTASLSGYERFSPVDRTATSRYERALAARLAALQSRHAPPLASAPRHASMKAENSIRLRTGNESSAVIEVTPENRSGPIVMEKVLTRPQDGIVTRHTWVARQGGEIVAVTIPRSRVSSPSDVLIEESIR